MSRHRTRSYTIEKERIMSYTIIRDISKVKSSDSHRITINSTQRKLHYCHTIVPTVIGNIKGNTFFFYLRDRNFNILQKKDILFTYFFFFCSHIFNIHTEENKHYVVDDDRIEQPFG